MNSNTKLIEWMADFPEVIPPEKMTEVSNLALAQPLVQMTIIRYSLGGEYIRNITNADDVFLQPLPSKKYDKLVEALTELFERYQLNDKLRTRVLAETKLGFLDDEAPSHPYCHQAIINIMTYFESDLHLTTLAGNERFAKEGPW